MKNSALSSLKIKAVNGVIMLIVREFIIKIIGAIALIILIRLLTPESFGIFAILSFIINFFDFFTDIGLTQALIRERDKLNKEDLSSVFFTQQFLVIVTILLIFLLSPFAIKLYPQLNSENLWMIRILSLTLLIKPLVSIITSLLERDLEYKIISIIDIVGVVVYYIFVLFFAYNHFLIWSFILAILIKEFIEFFILFFYKPWFPKLCFNFIKIRRMMHFGFYLQLGVIVYFIHQSTIPIIAGLRTTSYNIGLLDWSKKVSSVPRSVTENFGRVSLAGYSIIQGDFNLLSLAVEKSMSILGIISLFFIVILLGYGKELVSFILTDKWLPALPALNWFMGSIFFLGGTSALGQSIIVIGRTRQVLITSSLNVLFELILSYILIGYLGFVGIALGAFIGSLTLFISYIILGNNSGVKIKIKEILAPKIYTFIILIFFINVINKFFYGVSFFELILKISLTALMYAITSYLFSKKEIIEVFFLIKNKELKLNIN